jgi:pantothenate kinase type III
MVVGLNGYTTLTFDAAAQAAFVAGIAVLGGFETNRVEVTAVTDNKPAHRRELLQTVVGRTEHAVILPW